MSSVSSVDARSGKESAHVIGVIKLGEGVEAARSDREGRGGDSTRSGTSSAGSRAGEGCEDRHGEREEFGEPGATREDSESEIYS